MTIDPKSSYYDAGGIEVLDVLRAKLTPEQFQGFLLGNVLKYLCRYNHKHPDPARDCDKALRYLAILDEELTKAAESNTMESNE